MLKMPMILTADWRIVEISGLNKMQAIYVRQTPFYAYFKTQYASIVRSTMLKGVRRAVGLGSPPAIFTTNPSESVNAVIKRKVDYKATEWPAFNDSLKRIVDGQRDEAIRALSGRGQYRLTQEYHHLQVTPQQWARMTTQQRQEVVKCFDATPLHPAKGSSRSVTVSRELSIRPETSGIDSVPLATLKQIWEKATEYLNSSTDVISAPGPCRNAKMVASARPGIPPHYVHCLPSGQYLCDDC